MCDNNKNSVIIICDKQGVTNPSRQAKHRLITRFGLDRGFNLIDPPLTFILIDPMWFCGVYQQDLGSKSIICESCLVWYHQKCVSINIPPKKAPWFCHFCYFDCCERDATENKVSPCMHL